MTKKADSKNTHINDENQTQNNNDLSVQVEQLQNQVNDLENNWKRALADYRNLQLRSQEEKDSVVKYANLLLISRLLIILDNLNLMNQHINDKGLELIAKDFLQILTEEGLEEIITDKQEFDPTTMEAVEMVEGEKDKVVETVQAGYTLKGKLVRPARVKVGNGQKN